MAVNRKIDKAVKRSLAVAAVLCVLAAACGFLLAVSGHSYRTETVDTVSVSSIEDITSLGASAYNNHFVLTKDITVSDPELRIGSADFPFEGRIDGRGHTIRFTYRTADENTSLFDYLAPGAVIENVHFEFGNIRINGSSFGGIAKINDGTIKNCKLTVGSITLTEKGLFSPLVTINRGALSGIVVKSSVIGPGDEAIESDIFYGNACVYNAGTLYGVIVTASYSEFACTDELNILKGLAKNKGVSAVRYNDIGEGSTSRAVALLPDAQFTSDRTSGIAFSRADLLYLPEKIFDELDFDNRVWSIAGADLSLKKEGKP